MTERFLRDVEALRGLAARDLDLPDRLARKIMAPNATCTTRFGLRASSL